MAIEPLKRLTVVAPVSSPVLETLRRLGCVQVCDVAERHPRGEQALQRGPGTSGEPEENLRQADFILHLLERHAPKRRTLLDALAPMPMLVDPEEVDEAVEGFDLQAHFATAAALEEDWRAGERRLAENRAELDSLTPHAGIGFAPAALSSVHRTRLFYGTLESGLAASLDAGRRPWSDFAWELYPADRPDRTLLVLACAAGDAEAARKALEDLGFEPEVLPGLQCSPAERLRELEAEHRQCQDELEATAAKIRELDASRRTLTILKAYWSSQRSRELASAAGFRSKWIQVVCGWVRERDVDRLQRALAAAVPGADLLLEDPEPDDAVPVSLSMSRAWRPIQGLVSMFGLPSYHAFDPSPFLVLNFYLFFGICFSDVGYGLMLILVSVWLAARHREHRAAHDFARNLLYAGISTVVFGALLGGWFGDLPKYLGKGNLLLSLQHDLAVLNPMNKVLEALLLALGIGVLNQLYGIALKMYGEARQGNWTAAVCDGLFWLVALPGLLLVGARMFCHLPTAAWYLGVGLFAIGSLGLVLTQGRDVEHPVGRFATGLVSLYGIVGSYGFTAFVGDVLSYCRLLALGLTTSIVASTFNMLAAMVRSVPELGMALFVLLLVAGHLFNFLISLLGAFIHSMRLIYVEFFGRFYEGGARPFRPLGFGSSQCALRGS